MLGGLEWAGIPLVCEILGVSDPERLVMHLMAIRDRLNQKASSRG